MEGKKFYHYFFSNNNITVSADAAIHFKMTSTFTLGAALTTGCLTIERCDGCIDRRRPSQTHCPSPPLTADLCCRDRKSVV